VNPPAAPRIRRRLDPQARRLELLQAGERVLRRLGPAARAEDVTAAAGASKATLYVYFDTWEAFLLALRERVLADLRTEFEAELAVHATWTSQIAALPALFVDLTLGLGGLHRAVLHGPIAHVPPADTRYDIRGRIAELLRDAAEAGEVDAPDPAEAANFVYVLLREACDRVEAGGAPDDVIATCRLLLLRSLGVSPRLASSP
jgi:AcrR family transcriptional regulator